MIECLSCEAKKDVSEFQPSRLLRWVRKRVYPQCRACTNIQNNVWYQKNKEK